MESRQGRWPTTRSTRHSTGCRSLSASGLALAGLLATVACSPSTPPDPPYPERVAQQRSAKDAFFEQGSESPIPPDKRAEFLPLAYFPVDESYAVPASLVPSAREPSMEMPTSTGQRRLMRRAGALRFSLQGQPAELTAFVEAEARDMGRLFVPFGDMTNGTETYAAGRYLDLVRRPSGIYEVDFNLAYHPYCYYNPEYDCPYPPPENRLGLPVRAGERLKPSR
jgi:hypothetical protein